MRMMTAVTVACLLMIGGGLAGCDQTDPCTRLAAPTPAELAAAQSGAEVERTLPDGRNECDLINGGWILERDR